MRRPHIYGASKLGQAYIWKGLREARQDIVWTARWPDIEGQVPDTPENAKMFWLHDIADVMRADCVLVIPPEDNEEKKYLRGSLVEVGVALGLGKAVVLVGDCLDYGTWQYHPNVHKFFDMNAALAFICGDWVYA